GRFFRYARPASRRARPGLPEDHKVDRRQFPTGHADSPRLGGARRPASAHRAARNKDPSTPWAPRAKQVGRRLAGFGSIAWFTRDESGKTPVRNLAARRED